MCSCVGVAVTETSSRRVFPHTKYEKKKRKEKGDHVQRVCQRLLLSSARQSEVKCFAGSACTLASEPAEQALKDRLALRNESAPPTSSPFSLTLALFQTSSAVNSSHMQILRPWSCVVTKKRETSKRAAHHSVWRSAQIFWKLPRL